MSLVKSSEYLIKDLIFRLAFLLLQKGRPERIPIDPSKIRKVLFLRHDKIGDMVVSLPVFDNLKRLYPHLELSILCSPVNRSLIIDDPRFSKVFVYRKKPIEDLGEILRLRRENFDCVVDLINSDSTSGIFLARYSVKNRPRIGVQKKKFSRFYDFSYYHELDDLRHIIRNTLVVLEAFGIDSDQADPVAPPFLPESAVKKADDYMTSITSQGDFVTPPFFVGINLSVGQRTRRWSQNNCEELIKRLLMNGRKNSRVILFTAPSERQLGEDLKSRFDSTVEIIPPGRSLIEAVAIISRMNLFISPDTSLVHVARSFDIPVIGLYPKPARNFLQWHPYGFKEGAVLSQSGDHVFDITPDAVFQKYLAVMQKLEAGA